MDIKELFLNSLPAGEYYEREREAFERYGRRLGSLVLVVPPLRFSEDEIHRIVNYAAEIGRALPFTGMWTLNSSHYPHYIVALASALASSGVRSRVYADLPAEAVRILTSHAEVWVRGVDRWVRLDDPSHSLTGSVWRCDEIYHGLIRLNGDTWWFYYEGGRPSGCTRAAPPPTACDVHMIASADFPGIGEGIVLLTLPGAEPASNCGGSCGSANTLLNGTCWLGIRRLRGLIFASYMMTHTSEDPCPYHSYCGCFGYCDEPQLFVSDVRAVLREVSPEEGG